MIGDEQSNLQRQFNLLGSVENVRGESFAEVLAVIFVAYRP